jgi:3-methyl-2-oxobutanoate hydroxymethyltransferase
MSAQTTTARKTVPQIRQLKGPGALVVLTAYSTSLARLIDPHADVILVGDSLGMVVYGLPSTLAVTLEMMAAHGAAVVRGSNRACVVIDLPFGSYQESPQQAFCSAAALLSRTGAQAVKLEGGIEMAATVEFLVKRGVPVMSHVGLMPQQVHLIGGFKAQGLQADAGEKILRDARALEEAGAFAIVVECTAETISRRIVNELTIPVIGIGASPACDGQVLVTDDMLGFGGPFMPRFVKQYASLNRIIDRAVAQYAADVRSGDFPTLEHCFGVRTE